MIETATSIYGDRDPRDVPAYTVDDASRFLRVPPSTIRAWAGRKVYRVRDGKRRMPPLFEVDPSGLLSFNNLVEAFVVSSLTRHFKLPLARVRAALAFEGAPRPLLTSKFKTDRVGIYVERFASLVDASRGGQAAIREVVEGLLERVEFDADDMPTRFFPWWHRPDEPRVVAIDPRRSFGRPTVAGHGVKVDVLIDRFAGGESFSYLAKEYGMGVVDVEGAVRWGLREPLAA